jgi:hypothetical protein
MAAIPRNVFHKLAENIISFGAKKATKYLTKNFVIKATLVGKHGRNRRPSILFTYGAPNYLERKFIKDCQKAGESFPIKKIQVKFPRKK